jgi:hypothetical protein
MINFTNHKIAFYSSDRILLFKLFGAIACNGLTSQYYTKYCGYRTSTVVKIAVERMTAAVNLPILYIVIIALNQILK